MTALGLDAWISIIVTVTVVGVIQFRRGAPVDLLFLAGLIIVTLKGVISPTDAVNGFRSTAVIAIGSLFVVSAGLRATGVLDWVGEKLLGTAQDERTAIRRLAVALVSTSAFVLNTALVAMVVPLVVDWCRKRQISPSRLLIPVSYLTILGGVCTLIGTSTTLIVNSELEKKHAESLARLNAGEEIDQEFVEGMKPMGLFDLAWVGVPCALVGSVFLLSVGRRLLPDRPDMIERFDEQRREYLVEMRVKQNCRLIGQTVEAAGLRHLPGLFLIEIDREGRIITPVAPEDIIRAGDRLVFTGLVSTIVDLERIPGLVPAADQTYDVHSTERHMTEAVLSRTSPLIGATVREANFRRKYSAAVVAVHRNGARLTTKIGDIRLEPGDTLLLQTRTEFALRHRNNCDFYLVSPVEGYAPRRHNKAGVAAFLGIGLIVWLAALSWSPSPGYMPIAAIAVASLMIITRCVSAADARAALDLQVLLTIAGALGLGEALDQSGAADGVAKMLVNAVGDNPYALLVVVYLLALVFTEMITNNAVAAILLPLAVGIAAQVGHNPRPFVMAIALAASLSFITPIGYQTNLMVMGPGGYQPRDFLRAGLPLALIVMTTAVLLLPVVWPF